MAREPTSPTSQDRTFSSTLELLPASEGVTSGVLGRTCGKHFSLGARSLGVRAACASPAEPDLEQSEETVCQLSLGGQADKGFGKGIAGRRNSLSKARRH